MRRTKIYRGHRIVAGEIGGSWHAIIHGHTGSIVTTIEATSLANALAQAEWEIERRLRFAPPAHRVA